MLTHLFFLHNKTVKVTFVYRKDFKYNLGVQEKIVNFAFVYRKRL